MPYAYGAIIKHEYVGTLLKLWLTFRHQMLQSSDYSADPVVFDVFPPLADWLIEADSVPVDAIANEWIDEFTLLLTSDTVASRPVQVTLEYDGPDEGLSFRWGKQIEPFGPTLSTDLTATLWKTGMILLWSGSVATIPSGFALCNGSNGTPDLRDRFIVGAGSTYAPGATGGGLTHDHYYEPDPHFHSFNAGTGAQSGTGIALDTSEATIYGTTDGVNHLPPYYALCYIMKL